MENSKKDAVFRTLCVWTTGGIADALRSVNKS